MVDGKHGKWLAIRVTFVVCNSMVILFQALNRHKFAYSERGCDNKMVMSPGYYQWRDGGEKHMNDPNTVANIQVRERNLISV